LEFYHQT